MVTENSLSSSSRETNIEGLQNALSSQSFQDWYRERQYRQNIQDGTPYFNEGGHVPDPERHSPSQLLQCHRKILYRQSNAPSEEEAPEGIFWFGTKFEEEIVFPFLERAVTGPDTYVRNSEWVDFSVETDAGSLRIKGVTDPVIVDDDAVPILPTEIKTKSSVDSLTAPNRHHKAQLHAYIAGLSEKFDIEMTDGVLLYGSRTSLNLKTFHVSFDESFWEDVVLAWASEHTQHRLDDELPPANPEFDWECEFCDYRERCGKGSYEYSDHGPEGFLKGFEDYPREAVIEYLEANPEEKLTPTLAHEYADLVDIYGVQNWYCSGCESVISWTEIDAGNQPLCPVCADQGSISQLSLSSLDTNSQTTDVSSTNLPQI